MPFSPDDILSAAYSGRPSALRAVLESGGDPNAIGTKGLTPLCAAALALENSVEQVEVLLAWGADPTAETDDGRTALFFVQDPNVVERLIRSGIDPDRRDASGQTALFAASSNLLPEVVRAMLDVGLPAHDTDDAGNTPLHAALKSPLPDRRLPTPPRPGKFTTPNYRPYRQSLDQLLDVLTGLVRAGARPQAVNADDETPLSLAAEAACEAPFHSDAEWLSIIDTLVQEGAHLRSGHTGDTAIWRRIQHLKLYELARSLQGQ